MQRRQVLQTLGSVLVSSAFSATPSLAEEVREIRIGYQKAGILPALKQRRTLETAFKPQGISIKWNEFAFGPPILEGINTGNLDLGFSGDAPPIFAQAAVANLVYAATLPAHSAEAIIVPEDSPIKTLADLKGKKVGVGKASSAHTTLIYALEKAGVPYSDIQSVYLAPPDAAAAFSRGSIDAWSIWDPYLALAQQGKVRVLAYATDVHHPNHFFLANKTFAAAHPGVLTKLLNTIAVEAKWDSEHRADVAQTIHDASGIDLAAISHAMDRTNYVVEPTTDAIADSQQEIADRFLKLHLLPKPVVVRDVVWTWTPSI